MTKNKLEKNSTKPNFICLWLSIVLKSCFRVKHMLDTDQGVASEIMSFRLVITNAQVKANF